MYIYTAYNLCIHSEILLPELLSAEGTPDVIVRRGNLDNVSKEIIDEGHHVLSPLSLGVRFLIQEGKKIIFDATPEAEDGAIRALLLGFAMSLILRQRGLLVLHASSVVINGEVVGFMGNSGWGKSTLAEAFRTCGYPMMSDDVMPINLDRGYPIVLPSFPQIKLCPESATVLGHDTTSLPRVMSGQVKLAHRFTEGFQQSSLPLKKIYVLGKGDNHEIIPLQPQVSLIELVRHTRSTNWIKATEFAQSNLLQCSSLVKSVPICRFNRKPNLGELAELVRLVEQDVTETEIKVDLTLTSGTFH